VVGKRYPTWEAALGYAGAPADLDGRRMARSDAPAA